MSQLTDPQTFGLACQHHQAGRLSEAESLYRQILARQPDNTDVLVNLSVLAHQNGRDDVSAELIRRAIVLKPNLPEAHNTLGTALRGLGQLDEAIAAYRQAIALRPEYFKAQTNLGAALTENNQFDAAITALARAIALQPGFAEAHNNLGNALNSQGRIDQAIVAYRQAIALNPNYAKAHYNLANVLQSQSQLDEAIAAYHRAITLQPNFSEAFHNLGNALKTKGLVDQAVAAYRRAIALDPSSASAYYTLGIALTEQGSPQAASVAYREALALEPDSATTHSALVFLLHCLPEVSAEAIAAEHWLWNQKHAAPLAPKDRKYPNNPNPSRRLRIGYVSADFHTHASANFLLPLFQNHNSAEVELFCYAQVSRPDANTQRFRDIITQWRDTVGLSDEDLARQIRADGIDILVDLKLHTAGNRLRVFARKPAPVQATWLGYPGSTGLRTVDYRLSDPYLDPPGADESTYSEQTIRLPDTFWCYDPLEDRDIPVSAPPALARRFITFGCLNNFCKVNPEVARLWAQVMRQVPNSRFVLMAPHGAPRQRTVEQFRQHGIDPARIEFVSLKPRREYLKLYHEIDIGLDTFPYNGHTTSLDSFWMGVPVITLVGHRAVSRAGWCQLSNLGLTELAADTPQQFVQVAVQLANDPPRLKALRQKLRQTMEQSPLMNAPLFARSIEAAYRKMWKTWCDRQAESGGNA